MFTCVSRSKTYGTWRFLAHASRQNGRQRGVELLTTDRVLAMIGQPLVASDADVTPCAGRRRPSDAILALYPQLYRSAGALGQGVQALLAHDGILKMLFETGNVGRSEANLPLLRAQEPQEDLHECRLARP